MENKEFLFVPLVGKTSACRQKEGCKNNKIETLLPRLTAVLPPQGREMRSGFTLIELLVVVLIIGILAAVALPQYQKAVLKSRFSSLMPTTKSIADGQEMYYMTNGRYADVVSKLDVTTANTDDMSITLSDDADYAYTLATRPSLKNNLIMYQKHSVNYPGQIHCEALAGNTLANWVCHEGLKGSPIDGNITNGYNTYILEGDASGGRMLTGLEKTAKKICNESEMCIIDNTKNTVTSCDPAYGSMKDGRCVATSGSFSGDPYQITYDANGKIVSSIRCDTHYGDYGFECVRALTKIYNADGSAKGYSRSCSTREIGTDGLCKTGLPDAIWEYSYDAQGNSTYLGVCQGPSVRSDGTCSSYR